MAFRVVSAVIGGFFLLQGVAWLVDPASAAAGLGMTLQEGLGRSSQMGDTAGFFLALGAMVLFGAYRMEGLGLRGGALLLGAAAIARTLAWAFHGADFAAAFIAIEVLTTTGLLFLAHRLDAAGDATR